MEHQAHNPPETAQARLARGETPPWPLAIFLVSLLACVGLVELGGWAVYRSLVDRQRQQNQDRFPVNAISSAQANIPPEPLLEPQPSHDVLPRADLLEVRDRENAKIDQRAWAWVDAQKHFARIPVESAIDLAVQRGLPEQLPATQPSDAPFMPPASAAHGPVPGP